MSTPRTQRPTRRTSKRPPVDPVETVDQWVARHLDAAPPLNAEQTDLIRRLLAPAVHKRIAETGANHTVLPGRRSQHG